MKNSLLRRHAKGKKPLPEGLVLAGAQESCRLNRIEHCATFFALWSLYYPQSPILKDALARSRKKGSGVSSYLTPQSLATLRVLLGGAKPAEDQTYSAAEAERLTGRFRRHYHHAVPFRRDRLDEIWDRCREADCEERRIRAEAEIGIPHAEFDAQAGGISHAEARSE
jgi:hypothetical protein